ncbi:cholesterol oxidase substrate-binding domain-containing protein [Actinoplanes sp. NPDC026623]|uniref:cholesterol oxidase substrate-binding domain-containing protein n=1 Tax=Actinoplanes sp. NPDC026623 TaxID=3155610 RepID=UPI00340DCED8
MEHYRQSYRNWAGELRADDVWTAVARNAQDVVTLTNWAHRHGFALRAQGFRHGWAPLTLTAGTDCASRVVLVDTHHLNAMSLGNPGAEPGSATVRVEPGAGMEALLGFLESAGYGLTATPAPGDLSVGGALAVDAHGSAVPADGEVRPPGTTYGSLSNLILRLTAVVWDPDIGAYVTRSFERTDPDCAALLTNLGRAFLTEITLLAGPLARLRCVSRVDIPAAELFAAPGAGGRTLESFIAATGRVEAIWFPFTVRPWLKIWSVSPQRPSTSRPVTGPYNYPFSDNVPSPVADLAGRILAGQYELAPVLGQAQYAATAAGLLATASADLWGAAKNLQLYVRPTTLHVHANGYAVRVARSGVQAVVHAFTEFYTARLLAYAAGGRFPVNGAVEIRVTGVDDPADVAVPGAQAPSLSALRPDADRPAGQVAVWFDVLTLPGTADANRFYRELERYLLAAHPSTRVEWSKGWAYTEQAAWADPDVLGRAVPSSFGSGWDAAVSTLHRLDPARVFSNPFLDRLLRS